MVPSRSRGIDGGVEPVTLFDRDEVRQSLRFRGEMLISEAGVLRLRAIVSIHRPLRTTPHTLLAHRCRERRRT